MELPLVQKFSELLQKQDKDKKDEKLRKVSCAEEDLKRLLKIPEEFVSLKKLWKEYASALNIKSDREKSGSAWTMEMLKSYISVNEISLVAPGRPDLPEIVLQKIVERIDMSILELILTMRGCHEDLSDFIRSGTQFSESDIRMILDAILQPLCVFNNLRLRTEVTIKHTELPTNRYDYLMYDGGSPIGIVEAKQPGNVSEGKSVAQLLVQLLALSAEKPDLFYFGVLSDGCFCVFAAIDKKKILFFNNNYKKIYSEDIIYVTDHVGRFERLNDIVGTISWLIFFAKQSRKEGKSIEELGCRLEKITVWE